MLDSRLIEAVRESRFEVHVIERVDDAITLLFGREAGKGDVQGHFPEGSVSERVQQRLQAFERLLER